MCSHQKCLAEKFPKMYLKDVRAPEADLEQYTVRSLQKRQYTSVITSPSL